MNAIAKTISQSDKPKDAKALRISPRIRSAIDLMVWDGLTDNKAAVKIGITVTAIRLALKLPHVRAFYRAELEVLRQSESAQNIHALRQVRNQKSNQMARVAAVKALEQLNDAQGVDGSGQSVRPGVVIQILTQAPVQHVRTIDDERHAIISTG